MTSTAFLLMPKNVKQATTACYQFLMLLLVMMLIIPASLQAAGQRQNPWAYSPDSGQAPMGTRPWGNMPPAQPNQQPNTWHEPPAAQQYYPQPYQQPNTWHEPPVARQYYPQPYPQSYPYQDYTTDAYTDPYSGYGHPYNPYVLPGYGGGLNGIYPGLYGGPTAPGALFPYPGW